MSYSFTISGRVDSTPQSLFSEAGFEDVVCREEIDLMEPWPDGVLHFLRPQISCRVIEIASSDQEFDVRIMAYSSRDDYELALGLVEAAALSRAAVIHSEDGDEVRPNEFRSQFNDAWAQDMVQSAFGMFNMVRNQGGAATIPGATREFTIGPNLLDEFGFGGDPEEFATHFFAAFRNQQWINLEEYFQASVMAITPQGSTEQQTLSTIGAPGLKYLLQRGDLVGAECDGELVFVPWDRLGEALGERFQRLDENLVTIDAVSAADWPSVAAQMKSVSVSLDRVASKQQPSTDN